MLGRPIGVNLEPIDVDAKFNESRLSISKGRVASTDTFQRAEELGFDFVCLTGNPKTGVTNNELIHAVQLAKTQFSGLVIAGKMHQSGVAEEVMSINVAEELIEAGVDVILMP